MAAITTYLSAGSNLGDREANLKYALRELENAGKILRVSSYYETEPVGFPDQPWFLNMAIALETRLKPSGLLRACMGIEDLANRRRSFPNAPRTLDLDILFYGDSVIREKNLVIPHPRLSERKFVLEPLAEIAPDFMHPVFRQSVQSLLNACTDTSIVRLYQTSGQE